MPESKKNNNKKNSNASYISFICAIIPILIIVYCYIMSGGNTSEG